MLLIYYKKIAMIDCRQVDNLMDANQKLMQKKVNYSPIQGDIGGWLEN